MNKKYCIDCKYYYQENKQELCGRFLLLNLVNGMFIHKLCYEMRHHCYGECVNGQYWEPKETVETLENDIGC